MVIESSQHLMQHIDNGGLLSLDNHGQLQEQSGFARFFQNIGDALFRLSASGRAMIDDRNNRLGNTMHAMVARDNPLRNLAREALPQGGGVLGSEGKNMLARMEIGRQLVNFPPDTRPVVKHALRAAYDSLGPTSSTGILQFIEQKAKELRTTPEGRLNIHNQTMIQKMRTQDAEVVEAIDRGQEKGLNILGRHTLLDTTDFTRDMEAKIASSPTKVTPQMLEDMAEMTGRKILVESLIRNFIGAVPESANLTPREKTDLLRNFMEFPQAVTLQNASTRESAESQATIMKRSVALDFEIDRDCQALKSELFNAGLEAFCAKTGLTAEEGKKLNTRHLEDEMNRMRKEVDRSLMKANPENYHRADRNALMTEWGTMSKDFFDNRAERYNYRIKLLAPGTVLTQEYKDRILSN